MASRRRQNYTLIFDTASQKFGRRSCDAAPFFTELVEILVAHAFEFKDAALRTFLLLACKQSAAAFWLQLERLPPPDEKWKPLDDNCRERTSWAFATCHFCPKPAVERHTLFCLSWGKRCAALICRACPRDRRVRAGPVVLPGDRLVLSSLACQPPLRALADDSMRKLGKLISGFAAASALANLRHQTVSVQTWSGPRAKSIVRIHQLSLFLSSTFRRQLNVSIQLTARNAAAFKTKDDSAEKLRFLLVAATTKDQKISLLKTLGNWWNQETVQRTTVPAARRGGTPIRLLALPCQHSHGNGRGAELLSCSVCCPRGPPAPRKHKRGRRPSAS